METIYDYNSDRIQSPEFGIHNEKCFAMLNNSSAIRETDYEGIQAPIAVRYLINLINYPDQTFDSGITAEEKRLVLLALEDLLIFEEFFFKCQTENGIVIDHEELRRLTKERSDLKGGYCYWPSGWASVEREGHFSVVKLHH